MQSRFAGRTRLPEVGRAAPDTADGWNPFGTQYLAFLSYARADRKIVDDLFTRLQRYRTPAPLARQRGFFGKPPRSLKIFLDRKSLETGASLSDRLRARLESSAFLIVVCSQASSQSRWVNEEIALFLEQAGPGRIIPVIVRETPDTPFEATLPPALAALGDNLPVGADIHIDGGIIPVTDKVIGGLIGFPQDQISREQEKADRRQRRRLRMVVATISMLLAASVALGTLFYRERNTALGAVRAALFSATTNVEVLSNQALRSSVSRPFLATLVGESAAQLDEILRDDRISENATLKLARASVLLSYADVFSNLGDVAREADAIGDAMREVDALRARRFTSPVVDVTRLEVLSRLSRVRQALGDFPGARDAAAMCADDATALFEEINWNNDLATRVRTSWIACRQHEAGAFAGSLNPAAALNILNGDDLVRAVQKLPTDRTTRVRASIDNQRGSVLLAMGRPLEAAESFRRARSAIMPEGAASGAEDEESVLINVNAEIGHAESQGLAGARGEAVARLQGLINELTVRLRDDPLYRQIRFERARAFLAAGANAARGRNPATAADFFEGARADIDELLAYDPDHFRWRRLAVDHHLIRGESVFHQAETATVSGCDAPCQSAARAEFDAARGLLSGFDPRADEALTPLRVRLEFNGARIARFGGDREAGRTALSRAEAQLDAMADNGAAETLVRFLSAALADERGDQARAAGNLDDAVAAYEAAADTFNSLLTAQPEHNGLRRDAALVTARLIEARRDAGNDLAAAITARAACDIVNAGLGLTGSGSTDAGPVYPLLDQALSELTAAIRSVNVSCCEPD